MDSPDKSKATIGKLKEQIVDPATKKGMTPSESSSPGVGLGLGLGSFIRELFDGVGASIRTHHGFKDVPAELEFPGAAAPKPVPSTKPAAVRR